MSEPKALDADAAAQLQTYARQTNTPLSPGAQARVYLSTVERARNQPQPLWLVGPVFASAVALGAVAFATFSTPRPAPAPMVAAAKPAPVVLARGETRYVAGPARAVYQSAQLEVAAQNSTVLFDVSAAGTSVWVESGSVEVRPVSGTPRTVSAGESLFIPSAEAAALALESMPAEVEGCTAARGTTAWRECLQAQARGHGLTAETALFELSVEAQARRDFAAAEKQLRSYQQRFAQGAFAPEVSMALMRGLRDAGSTAAARAEAQRYLADFGAEPRAADVRRFLEQLK